MTSFLLLALLSFSAFAGLEKIHLKNLSAQYTYPSGHGEAEKVGIGTSFAPQDFVFQIQRTEESFDVTSDLIDFSWMNPPAFFHQTQSLKISKANVSLGNKTHSLDAEYLMLKPRSRGEYKGIGLKATCSGDSDRPIIPRLLEDCRTKMDLTIKKIDVPEDFIFYRLAEEYMTPEIDIPGDNLILTSRNGEYALQVYIKYWIYAGLRSWGKISYEDNYQTLAIKVDQIKFGYLTVTEMVMKKLQELNKNPNVKIDPPWIRIDIGSLNEDK